MLHAQVCLATGAPVEIWEIWLALERLGKSCAETLASAGLAAGRGASAAEGESFEGVPAVAEETRAMPGAWEGREERDSVVGVCMHRHN